MTLPPIPPLLIPYPVFRLISWLVFQLPGRDALKMAEFSHVELGSGMDMLAATADETDPLLRRKYFRHALDELKHSRMFYERARALSNGSGRVDRVQAVLEDMESPEFLAGDEPAMADVSRKLAQVTTENL